MFYVLHIHMFYVYMFYVDDPGFFFFFLTILVNSVGYPFLLVHYLRSLRSLNLHHCPHLNNLTIIYCLKLWTYHFFNPARKKFHLIFSEESTKIEEEGVKESKHQRGRSSMLACHFHGTPKSNL